MCVAILSRNIRSWEITTTQPGKSRSAFSKLPKVSTSKSFVGSSSSKRFPPCLSVRARFNLFLSPPDKTPAAFCWSWPLKPNVETYAREGISTFPTLIKSSPSLTTSQTLFLGSIPVLPWST